MRSRIPISYPACQVAAPAERAPIPNEILSHNVWRPDNMNRETRAGLRPSRQGEQFGEGTTSNTVSLARTEGALVPCRALSRSVLQTANIGGKTWDGRRPSRQEEQSLEGTICTSACKESLARAEAALVPGDISSSNPSQGPIYNTSLSGPNERINVLGNGQSDQRSSKRRKITNRSGEPCSSRDESSNNNGSESPLHTCTLGLPEHL
ncbi:hypothetical protein BDZ45DRAFT_247283 [Acephala macrosclerotiorum]|nr:hypothetical protein BDZ45DRAFT_247283 [Acephala macrosclerotiorum]